MSRLDAIRSRIAPARQRLLAHPLYARMASLDDVRVFMGSHVFAVWDFMSLLKRLQRDLTCVTVPWVPVGDAEVRFLINEIVCGEESDVDPRGGRIAHFDLYLRAMREADSDTSAVDKALASVRAGGSTATALVSAGVPAGAAAFSGATFALATNGKSHEVAAAFTFGREDLIPDMFTELVTRLSREYPGKLDTFRYYLERHIEVDGGHHGAISLRMVELLCGDDDRKWDEAAVASLHVPDMDKLRYVFDAVTSIRKALNGRVPLIGFSGSPWTLATYMVEGGSSKDFAKVKSLAFNEPELMHLLLSKLVNSSNHLYLLHIL